MATPDRSIFTPLQVREIDRRSIQELGISAYTLMSRAGHVCFQVARQRFASARQWLILCGAGNNAGDGYVIARLAKDAGYKATVVALGSPDHLRDAAAQAWDAYRTAGGETAPFSADLCKSADLVVDALLGTGLDRCLDAPYLEMVRAVNSAARPVLAVDIPTGLHGASGEVLGEAIRAQCTVTLVGRKLGLYIGQGPDYAGEVLYDGLGIPTEIFDSIAPVAHLQEAGDLKVRLPRRQRTAHKGLFGHVLVIGGNHGMGGSVRLAGEAALRAGAGLVSVATRPGNVAAVTGYRPELMSRGAECDADLDTLLEKATVVAVGPGLGQDDWARGLFLRALRRNCPLVIDADALNLLAQAPRRQTNWILTPHPGEAGRLLGRTTQQVQADRPAALQALHAKYGGAVILKGRCTLIGCADRPPCVVNGGNPGMASGGMGDVLTGVVAGVWAQHLAENSFETAALAAGIHAMAGDLAATHGERGLVAGDVLLALRQCMNPCD